MKAPVPAPVALASAPLRTLFVLSAHEGPLRARRLRGAEQLTALQDSSYGPLLPAEHERQFALTGQDRWLIRQAMAGRLPDPVRLNRRRGRQAGDLVVRLRACSPAVEAALEEVARGPAAGFVDVQNLREAWRIVRTQDDPMAFHRAGSVLTRGLMAGLFVAAHAP